MNLTEEQKHMLLDLVNEKLEVATECKFQDYLDDLKELQSVIITDLV